jgi:hypothetical protein
VASATFAVSDRRAPAPARPPVEREREAAPAPAPNAEFARPAVPEAQIAAPPAPPRTAPKDEKQPPGEFGFE